MTTRKTLNVRFVLALLIVVGVAVGGVFAVHRRQADKQAGFLLARADAVERDGDTAAAADYLRRYLTLRPNDTAARGRLGLAMADAAVDAEGLLRALLVLDHTVREDPSRDDLRRRAVVLGITLGTDTLPGARDHLKTLLKSHPDDAELHFLMGKCQELAEVYADRVIDEEREPGAESEYRAAIARDPGHVHAASRLAGVLRTINRGKDADAVVTAMVGRNPRSALGQLAAAVYWRQVHLSGFAGERAAAQKQYAAAVAAALALAPDDPAAVQAAADLAIEKSRDADRKDDPAAAKAAADEAAGVLERGIAAVRPPAAARTLEGRSDAARHRERVARLYHTRAALALEAGRLDEAETWVGRGLEAVPDSAGLVGLLVETFTRGGQLDKAEAQIARLRELKHPEGLVRYRQARVRAARGDWLGAAKACESGMADLAVNPDLSREAHFFLGECYERLGQPDRRQAALRETVRLTSDTRDPLWGTARAKLAAALTALGRTADAIRVYEELAGLAPAAKVPLARLLLSEVLRRPAADRGVEAYARVEAALAAAPATAEADLVRVEVKHAVEHAKTKTTDAEKVRADVRADVRAVRDKYPNAIEPYLALSALEGADLAAAGRWLDEAKKNPKIGDRVDLRLARARLAGADAAKLQALADGDDTFTPTERVRLLVGLAEIAVAGGADAAADRLLDRAAAASPNDLAVLLARFERAVRTDRAKATALLTDIRRLDEFGGTSAKMAEAVLLLRDAESKPADDPDRAAALVRAGELLGEIEPLRPGWGRIPLARAAVHDLQGDKAGAAAGYRRAIELGVRDTDVVRRLTELYYAQQRFTDVNDLLRSLPGTPGVTAIAAEAALVSGDVIRAAELAGQAVPAGVTDPARLMWLGHVRYQAKDKAGAEEPFRRATVVAPESPGPWVALVGYLAAEGRKSDAEAVIADAGRKVKPADRTLTLATCYEAVGRTDRAAEQYRRLAADKPTDPAALREAGRFYLRAGKPDEAAILFRKVLAVPNVPPDDAATARRFLAVSLASKGDHRAAAEALQVLGPGADKTPRGDEPVEELKARAVVLAAHPDRKRRAEAAATFERIEARSPLGPDDQFLLAQLYAALNDRGKTRPRFATLVTAHPDNPVYLATFARWLLSVNDPEAARPLVERLAKLAPDTRPTIELTARLLTADGKPDEAAGVLVKFADGPPDRAGFALTLLEQLGLGDKAEPVAKRLASSAGRVGGAVVWAEFLGRRGKVREAIDALTPVRTAVPPETLARAAVHVLYGGRKAGADDPRADDLVAEAARRAPGDPKVLVHQAMLADYRGRYDEAARVFRQVIAAGPAADKGDLALALNNLAFLVSVREGKHDEALALIRQAREAVGPSPDLSDTEGYLHLARKDAAAAAEALADSLFAGGGPVARYHMALAHAGADDKLRATTEWVVAHKAGFSPLDLHPLERPEYERAKQTFGR